MRQKNAHPYDGEDLRLYEVGRRLRFIGWDPDELAARIENVGGWMERLKVGDVVVVAETNGCGMGIDVVSEDGDTHMVWANEVELVESSDSPVVDQAGPTRYVASTTQDTKEQPEMTITPRTKQECLEYAEGDVAFAEWLARCDRLVVEKCGVGMFDLSDWMWRDAFDDDAEPEDAVDDFIAEEGIDTIEDSDEDEEDDDDDTDEPESEELDEIDEELDFGDEGEE